MNTIPSPKRRFCLLGNIITNNLQHTHKHAFNQLHTHSLLISFSDPLLAPPPLYLFLSLFLSFFHSLVSNRFELYLAGQNQYELIKDAITYLEDRAGGSLDQATLRRSLFMLSGEDAIWHLLKVSAGLDSLIVGEGQVRYIPLAIFILNPLALFTLLPLLHPLPRLTSLLDLTTNLPCLMNKLTFKYSTYLLDFGSSEACV